MNKNAKTDFPVHPLIEKRWSPRSFENRPVDSVQLRSLFEAARWAPSCFNLQPWRYIAASQREEPETYKKILNCLVEGNQGWAVRAPALVVSFAKRTFENGELNPHAWHDVGLANGLLVVQATQFGMSVHMMAGVKTDEIREAFNVPDDVDVVAVMAIGFVGNPAILSSDLEKRERVPRERTPQNEFLFGETWGRPFRG